ncbi:MAG TPA: ATP-binding cassette domain-containing protein [Kofleriaceae bacterium]
MYVLKAMVEMKTDSNIEPTIEAKIIELVGVRLDHPKEGLAPLLREGSLGVAPGEVVVIVGSAGVGTSRLAAALIGECTPQEGAINVFGRDVTKLRRSSVRLLRRRVGVVPQDLSLLEDRSAQLNVVLPLEIFGVPRGISIPRAAEVLAQMGLEDEASMPVDCLSTSARQRVAVARALVRAPELLVADHPTSSQDSLGAERVCEAFYEAAAQGAAVIIFSRDPQLRAIAERNKWRQMALVEGLLRPLGEIELDGRTIEDVLVGIESAPTAQDPLEDPIPNVLPFPITARTAGAR